MVTELKPREDDTPHVRLVDDGVIIEHHFTSDPQVRCRFEVTEPETYNAELDGLLTIGATVVSHAAPLLDAAAMRREMQAAAQQSADAVKEEMAGALEPLLDADGTLMRSLREVKSSLDERLDPDKANNAYTLIEATVHRVVARALDPDDENGPMGRAVARIVKRHDEREEKIVDLYAKIGGLVERRDERQSSTAKGGDYQEAIFEELARIAAIHGDSFEPSPNAAGTKSPARRGDGVVTVNAALTQGVPVRVVFEAGDRAKATESSVLAELDGAKENREALAAVAVLPSPGVGALRGRRLRPFADARFACVLEKETWDALPLELAYVMAKAAALQAACPRVDFSGVASEVLSLTDKALRQLDKVDGVRAQFRKANEGMSAAETLVTEIKAEVRATLTQVVALLQAPGS